MGALPTSRSIGLSSEGVGEDGGMRGGGGGEEQEEDGTVGDKGGGRGGGVKEGVSSEETVDWRESKGGGEMGVGEIGGGRDGGGGLKGRVGGTEAGGGLEERGLETGGRGGGRDGGVDGGRGGREGSWEDFKLGGGGLGRRGRVGGWEEGRERGERGEDGGMESGEGVVEVSSAPVRGVVWPASWETTLASIILPQIECSTALCHSASVSDPSKTPPPLCPPTPSFLPLVDRDRKSVV